VCPGGAIGAGRSERGVRLECGHGGDLELRQGKPCAMHGSRENPRICWGAAALLHGVKARTCPQEVHRERAEVMRVRVPEA
jgi:hypothetical protein